MVSTAKRKRHSESSMDFNISRMNSSATTSNSITTTRMMPTPHSRGIALTRWQGLTTTTMAAVLLLFSNSLFCCHAFSSEYKPPVKSSLQTFQDRRLKASSSVPIVPNNKDGGSSSSHKKKSERNAAATYDASFANNSNNHKPASFERRMRQAIFGVGNRQRRQQPPPSAAATATESTRTKPRRTANAHAPPSNWITIESLQDYKTIVGQESQRRVVVVRFHATYCRACQAVAPYFLQLARKCCTASNNKKDVLFVNVPVTNRNAALHRGLQVPSLPFCHVYYPGAGLVEERGVTRKQFADFTKTLQSYMRGSCPLPTVSQKEEEEEEPKEQPKETAQQQQQPLAQ
mmetsp:Transcript_23306/g.55113  ORF Transcript_23306/g.55113 Transcript_23306/m.55113 type:complete len:346 (-) Transcript_23306:131-1168(-)